MRHSYAALCLLLGTGFTANAQLLNLTNADNEVVNSSTVYFNGTPSDPLMEKDLTCTLNGGQSKSVRLKRYELEPVPMGTQNYFCWDICWLAANAGVHPVWNSNDAVVLAPGVAFEGFHAYYKPQGIDATACFRYVWYDSNVVNDSVWVDICFSTNGAGVEDLSISGADVNIVPNPSNGAVPMMRFSGASTQVDGMVVVRSATGATVATERKRTGQTTVALAGELPEGVYFASLEQEGRALVTQRMVITR